MLSVALLLQSGIRLATTLSLALNLLYLSLPLRHSYSVRHLGLVGSHDRNPSASASGVLDILALYKLDYNNNYYYYALKVVVFEYALPTYLLFRIHLLTVFQNTHRTNQLPVEAASTTPRVDQSMRRLV